MYTSEAADEKRRLQNPRDYFILDTPREQVFDDLAPLATGNRGIPFALITLVDRNRARFKAKKGITVNENPRDGDFGARTIPQHDVRLMTDASLDAGFSANSLTALHPNINFYAGMPARKPAVVASGAICVLDVKPGTQEPAQIGALRMLARQACVALESRTQVNV